MRDVILLGFERREIFTFVDGKTGENYHVDSGALREWCAANRDKLEVFMIPIERERARMFLEVDKSVTLEHAAEVAKMPRLDPLIYCKFGTYDAENGAPDVMLADGHHRYFVAAAYGRDVAPSYLLEREQWEQFRVSIPDMTIEQLRDSPSGR